MTPAQTALAQMCLDGAHTGALSFPQIVETLLAGGFESYAIDFRAGAATYYRPEGDTLVLPFRRPDIAVRETFDTARIQTAIQTAQAQAADYCYDDFCAAIVSAGCAGYIVSLAGRRAVYIGRTGAVHVEPFPPR